MFLARTGCEPAGVDTRAWLDSLVESADPEAPDELGCYASWAYALLYADSSSQARTCIEQEFLPSLPDDIPSWLEGHPGPGWGPALFRQMIHLSASGLDVELSADDVDFLRDWLRGGDAEVRVAALEALGGLGVRGMEGVIPPFEDAVPSERRALLRYLSELGGEAEPDREAELPPDLDLLPPADRVYAARCARGEAEMAELLRSGSWAVRFEAARIAPESLLEPLLDDPNLQVALEAAGRLHEAGEERGTEALEEMSGIHGPIGYSATARLGPESLELLRTLAESDDPSTRAASQAAMLEIGGEVCSLMVDTWLSDPYWLVPCRFLFALAGDSTRRGGAEALAVDLLESRGGSDPDLRDCVREFLEFLHGDTPGPEPGAWGPGFPLPFDPARMDVPEEMVVETSAGNITIELFVETAPVTCAGFAYLAGKGFYDGIRFHRVIPAFVVQAGCPEGNGTGGPGYLLPNERSLVRFEPGVVGMADAGLDTGGSQFFIMLDRVGRLDGRYTAFGRVVSGMDVVEEVSVGTRITTVRPAR